MSGPRDGRRLRAWVFIPPVPRAGIFVCVRVQILLPIMIHWKAFKNPDPRGCMPDWLSQDPWQQDPGISIILELAQGFQCAARSVNQGFRIREVPRGGLAPQPFCQGPELLGGDQEWKSSL